MKTSILFLFALTLSSSIAVSAFAADSATNRTTAATNRSIAAAKEAAAVNRSEMDQALAEFTAAAQRLGKSLAKVADENTVEAREKIKHTMSGAMRELSQSMNQASKKLEAAAPKAAKAE